jgi:hypothetical protein
MLGRWSRRRDPDGLLDPHERHARERHTRERHTREMHTREMHTMRGMPLECTPRMDTLTGCMPARYFRRDISR